MSVASWVHLVAVQIYMPWEVPDVKKVGRGGEGKKQRTSLLLNTEIMMEEWGNDFVLSINQHLDTISWFTKYLHVIFHKPFQTKTIPSHIRFPTPWGHINAVPVSIWGNKLTGSHNLNLTQLFGAGVSLLCLVSLGPTEVSAGPLVGGAWEERGQNLVPGSLRYPCPDWLSGGSCSQLLEASTAPGWWLPPMLQISLTSSLPRHLSRWWTLWPPSSDIQGSRDYAGSLWIIQVNFLVFRSPISNLNAICKVPL